MDLNDDKNTTYEMLAILDSMADLLGLVINRAIHLKDQIEDTGQLIEDFYKPENEQELSLYRKKLQRMYEIYQHF